jgi:hypothetical protein
MAKRDTFSIFDSLQQEPISHPHLHRLDWLPPEDAFKLLGLKLGESDDRKLWSYFVSPVVDFIIQRDDGTLLKGEGPYRILEDGSIADVSEVIGAHRPPGLTLASARLSYLDIRHILDNCPYLFDSLATTALKVETREILAVPTKSKPLSPLEAPEIPGANADRQQRLSYLRERDAYEAEVLLNLDPLALWNFDPVGNPLPNSPFATCDKLYATPSLFKILSAPWSHRSTMSPDPVIISPLFALVQPMNSILRLSSAKVRLRETNRFIGRERVGEELGGAHLEAVMFDDFMAEVNNAPYPMAWHPNMLERAETLRSENFLNLPGVPFLYRFYLDIIERQNYFLRHQPRAAKRLPVTRCLECGADLKKVTPRRKGPAPVCCPGCDTLYTNAQRETKQTQSRRNHAVRRKKTDADLSERE